MAHPKLASFVVMLLVFGTVGTIAWAIYSSRARSEIPPLIQEQVRDSTMAYLRECHPEAAHFITEVSWSGGRVESGLLGAETYVYVGKGWNVTIRYPVVANPVYEVTAEYSAEDMSIPYSLIWHGNWTNGTVKETDFTFAQ